jgi:hypothetical protein
MSVEKLVFHRRTNENVWRNATNYTALVEGLSTTVESMGSVSTEVIEVVVTRRSIVAPKRVVVMPEVVETVNDVVVTPAAEEA